MHTSSAKVELKIPKFSVKAIFLAMREITRRSRCRGWHIALSIGLFLGFGDEAERRNPSNGCPRPMVVVLVCLCSKDFNICSSSPYRFGRSCITITVNEMKEELFLYVCYRADIANPCRFNISHMFPA
jgi:hypothetical protein